MGNESGNQGKDGTVIILKQRRVFLLYALNYYPPPQIRGNPFSNKTLEGQLS